MSPYIESLIHTRLVGKNTEFDINEEIDGCSIIDIAGNVNQTLIEYFKKNPAELYKVDIVIRFRYVPAQKLRERIKQCFSFISAIFRDRFARFFSDFASYAKNMPGQTKI